MNIHIEVLMWTYFLLGKYLAVEMMGHIVVLCLSSWELLKKFSKVTSILFPQEMHEGVHFSTSLLALVFGYHLI